MHVSFSLPLWAFYCGDHDAQIILFFVVHVLYVKVRKCLVTFLCREVEKKRSCKFGLILNSTKGSQKECKLDKLCGSYALNFLKAISCAV